MVSGWWCVVTGLRFVLGVFVAVALHTPVPVTAQGLSVDAVKLAEAGSQALDERRFADALASFTAAAKLAPRNAEIAFGVGVSAYMLGQNAEAERQFLRTLQLNPALQDASILLGELQYRSGRISDAVQKRRKPRSRDAGYHESGADSQR